MIDLNDAQQALADKLNEALIQVATLGQELADTSHATGDGRYLVDGDTMTELKQACDEWTNATQAFLSSISVVSSQVPDPTDTGALCINPQDRE